MDLIPTLQIGFLNGWLFFIAFALTELIHIKICSKEVQIGLFDRKNWNKTQKTFLLIQKSFGLINIILFFLTPLVIGQTDFIVGIIIYFIGLIILHTAIYDFRVAPLDKPITNGLYKYSRNPQLISLDIIFIGICFMIGSWLSIIILAAAIFCEHFAILGEEKRLCEQYGKSYEEFKKKVPRYFLFF